jgi:hypothetical protein
MAEVFGVKCSVNQAGAACDGGEGPNPVIYINLTDTAGSFAGQWFYTAEVGKREMLAVALAAINTQSKVLATIDPPKPGNNPYTVIFRLYLSAS